MIRGRFGRIGGPDAPLAPLLTAELRLDGQPEFAQIEFLVDTGADQTTIHPADARRLWGGYSQHDFESDATVQVMRGIGGTARFITRRVSVVFFEEDGEAVSGDFNLNIAESREDNRDLPSLLGRDILRHVRLIVDEPGDLIALQLPD